MSRLPSGVFARSYEEDMAIVRTLLNWGWVGVLFLGLFTFPLLANPYLVRLSAMIAITAIAAQGLNLCTGYCGQVSLGTAAFMAVGAYTSAILTTKFGQSFWLTMPIAGMNAALIGAFFGLPSLRVKGMYLAMATVAAHAILIYFIIHASDLTDGVQGVAAARPSLGPISFESNVSFYYLIVVVTFLMMFFAKNLVRTDTGRAFVAIRDNDLAAEVMGVNLLYHKLLAFAISGFYAGIAGALWAHLIGRIDPEHFTLFQAIWFLGMICIGGSGTIAGAILGAIFLTLLDEGCVLISPLIMTLFPQVSQGITTGFGRGMFGLVLIIFLVFEPRGLVHRWGVLKLAYSVWPFRY